MDEPSGEERMEDQMKLISTAVIITVVCLFASASMAASDKCVVVKAEGKMVTLECKKDTDRFAAGTEVKIKSNRKAAVEGC